MTLEWRKLPSDEACYVTACGRYSVGFDAQHGVWRSYRLAPGGPWFAPLSAHVASEEQAKAICEADQT